MTASSPAPRDDTGVREELAAAFMDLWREQAGALGDPATITGAGDVALEYADALLPTVQRLIDQGKAEALREAADEMAAHGWFSVVVTLRATAAALDPTEGRR